MKKTSQRGSTQSTARARSTQLQLASRGGQQADEPLLLRLRLVHHVLPLDGQGGSLLTLVWCIATKQRLLGEAEWWRRDILPQVAAEVVRVGRWKAHVGEERHEDQQMRRRVDQPVRVPSLGH